MSLNVRPCKVLQAANWLRTIEGVIFDSNWINTYNYNVENDSDVCDINLEDEPQNEDWITEPLYMMMNGVKMKQKYQPVIQIPC